MVDAVVREWIQQMLGKDAAACGYDTLVNQLLVIFYADDVLLAGRDPVQLQEAMDVMVDLFG